MGGEESALKVREESAEELDGKLREGLVEGRMRLSHQSNIWRLVKRLKETYGEWEIT